MLRRLRFRMSRGIGRRSVEMASRIQFTHGAVNARAKGRITAATSESWVCGPEPYRRRRAGEAKRKAQPALWAIIRQRQNWYLVGPAEIDRGDEGQDGQARWGGRACLRSSFDAVRSNESLAFVLSANFPNAGRADIHVVSLMLKANSSGSPRGLNVSS